MIMQFYFYLHELTKATAKTANTFNYFAKIDEAYEINTEANAGIAASTAKCDSLLFIHTASDGRKIKSRKETSILFCIHDAVYRRLG